MRLVQLGVPDHGNGTDSSRPARLPAGNFSEWLRDTEALLRSRKVGVNVPCGSCRGCCRSSMFIHVKPEEKETLRRIPRALLFPAPGLPKGHVLMGYGDSGQCPMFMDGKCSIYEHRPQTCRDYDCRIFAATGMPVDEHIQSEIARRVSEWVFSYDTEEDRAEHTTLQRATTFLRTNRDLFPEGSLPSQPGPLAAIAVNIYRLFADMRAETQNSAAVKPDAAIVRAIMTTLSEQRTPPRRAALTEGRRPRR